MYRPLPALPLRYSFRKKIPLKPEHLTIVGILICFFSLSARAQTISQALDLQDKSQRHFLITKEGERLVGRILSIQDTELRFLFRGSEQLSFQFRELQRIGVLGTDDEALLDPAAPAKTNELPLTYNIIAPTAAQPAAGEIHYQNANLLWNTVQVGVSDNFSLGGGFIVPVFVVVNAKLSQSLSRKDRLAIQSSGLFPLFGIEDASAGQLSVVYTRGSNRKYLNVTLGTGLGFDNRAVFGFLGSVGGAIPFSPKVALQGELLYVSSVDADQLLPSISLNIIGQHNRFTLGVVTAYDEFLDFFAVPLLTFVHRFN